MSKRTFSTIDGIIGGLIIVLALVLGVALFAFGGKDAPLQKGDSLLMVVEQAEGSGPSTGAANALQPNVGNTGSCGTKSIQSATCVNAQDVK